MLIHVKGSQPRYGDQAVVFNSRDTLYDADASSVSWPSKKYRNYLLSNLLSGASRMTTQDTQYVPFSQRVITFNTP